MMRRVLISLLLAVTATLVASAQVERHEFKVGDFSRLTLIDDINVNYRCNADSAGMVVATCSQEVLDHILFKLSNKGRLSIQLDDFIERMDNQPTLTIYSSSLDEAENDGDSTLRVMGLPPMKAFKARLTDNGKIIVRGVHASQLELHILSGKGKSLPRAPATTCHCAWWVRAKSRPMRWRLSMSHAASSAPAQWAATCRAANSR